MFNDDVKWLPNASNVHTIESMLDALKSGTLCLGTIEFCPPKPTLYQLVEKKGTLINELVKIFIGQYQFVPENITEAGTMENRLFWLLCEVVMYLDWAEKIKTKSGIKWHSEELDRIREMHRKYKTDIDFPALSGDILDRAREGMENDPKLRYKSDDVIEALKDAYDIKRIRLSDDEKMIIERNKIFSEFFPR